MNSEHYSFSKITFFITSVLTIIITLDGTNSFAEECKTVKCAIGTKNSTWKGITTNVFNGSPSKTSVTVQFFPSPTGYGAFYSQPLSVFSPSITLKGESKNNPNRSGKWSGSFYQFGNSFMLYTIRSPGEEILSSQVAIVEYINDRLIITPLDDPQAAITSLKKVS